MSPVLQYSLGLSTSQFLGAINSVQGRLGGLLRWGAAFAGIGAPITSLFQQIQKGAALSELSKRTGETAGNLFKLQRGFELAGVSMQSVPTVLFQMNKALGGVNEQGEPTAKIFSQMGLSIDQLRQAGGADALQRITATLGRMDRAGAAMAASKIFGRGGAQDMLQLARSTEDFSEGMAGAAEGARILDANADRFDKLADSLILIKNAWNDMALRAAVPVATFLSALSQAYKEGVLTDFVAQSFTTGLEMFIGVAPSMLAVLGSEILNLFTKPLVYLQTGFEWLAQQLASSPIIAKVFGLGEHGVRPEAFGDILDRNEKTGPLFGLPGGTMTTEELRKFSRLQLDQALAEAKKNAAPFAGRLADLAARFQGGANALPENAFALGDAGMGRRKSDTDIALERIGFSFAGGPRTTDYARDTAANTGRLVKLTQKLVDRAGAPGKFANLPE